MLNVVAQWAITKWFQANWRSLLIAAVAAIGLYCAYRIYAWDQSRLIAQYEAGHAAASTACESAKARAIIQGNLSREKNDREFQTHSVDHADRFNADHGFLRD